MLGAISDCLLLPTVELLLMSEGIPGNLQKCTAKVPLHDIRIE